MEDQGSGSAIGRSVRSSFFGRESLSDRNIPKEVKEKLIKWENSSKSGALIWH